jgi:hypothetical protein
MNGDGRAALHSLEGRVDCEGWLAWLRRVLECVCGAMRSYRFRQADRRTDSSVAGGLVGAESGGDHAHPESACQSWTMNQFVATNRRRGQRLAVADPRSMVPAGQWR